MKRRNVVFFIVAVLIVIAIIVLSFSVFQRALAPAAPTAEATWTGEVHTSSLTWSGV